MTDTLADLSAYLYAAPLTLECGFKSVTLSLDDGMREAATRELAALSRGRSGLLVDLLLAQAWDRCGTTRSLTDFYSWLSHDLLKLTDGALWPCSDNDGRLPASGEHATLRWRAITYRVPAALLVGAHAGHAIGGPTLCGPDMEALFRQPWANIHLHSGAATDFDSWWVERLILGGADCQDALDRSALLAAGLLRLLLRLWLHHDRTPSDVARALDEASEFDCARVMQRWVDRILAGAVPSADEDGALSLAEVGSPHGYSCRGHDATSWCGVSEEPDLGEARTQETWLVAAYFARPDAPANLNAMFWQYQRLRLRYYERVVAPPGTVGLQRFARFFGVIGKSPRQSFQKAVPLETRTLNLAALEVRPVLPSRALLAASVQKWCESAATELSRPRRGNCEIGIVVSVLKPDTVPGPPTIDTMRFYECIRELASSAEAIAEQFSLYPELSALVRGFDLANQELNLPTWVAAPFMRRMRDALSEAVRSVEHRTGKRLRPGGMTAHAGEESSSVYEGLRRIDELLSAQVLSRGDRIGHGLALGQLPLEVARRQVIQRREDRLFDILWQIEMHRRAKVDLSVKRLTALRTEVTLLLGNFSDALAEGIERLPSILLGASFGDVESWLSGLPTNPILRAYLSDSALWSILNRPVTTSYSDEDLQVAEDLRVAVCNDVEARDITVEFNPSSNLVVADLGQLSRHPVFSISPADGVVSRTRIRVALCDDDPLTFATCLADEAAYMYAALSCRPEQRADEALAWVDNSRRAALDARFTVPSEVLHTLVEELKQRLQSQY